MNTKDKTICSIHIYCLLNDKKYAQKVKSKDLMYKKPFGY